MLSKVRRSVTVVLSCGYGVFAASWGLISNPSAFPHLAICSAQRVDDRLDSLSSLWARHAGRLRGSSDDVVLDHAQPVYLSSRIS
jgi:hypothetical protein